MVGTSFQFKRRCIALGFFDGVHLGHAALLSKVKERAAELGAVPSVFTFDNHPDSLLSGKTGNLLGDTEERKDLIGRLFGIEDFLCVPFTAELMNLPWESFASALVSEVGAVWVIVGYNFVFGARGEGNAEKLKHWCVEHRVGCDIIEPIRMDGIVISSTRIRELLEEGKTEHANRYLGHPHCLTGTVREGYHIGRTMNTPTINMSVPKDVLIPRIGVYASGVVLSDGTKKNAVTNIGVRPTFGNNREVTVESHILEYSGNLYGSRVRLELFSYIREERKFEDPEKLSLQIQTDIAFSEKFFKNC